MSHSIVYSARAKSEYRNILIYVIEEFGVDTARKVDDLFDKVILQIADNPEMYPVFDKKRKIRKCVVSRQTSMFYKINKSVVEIISFRGNLMNPKTLKF